MSDNLIIGTNVSPIALKETDNQVKVGIHTPKSLPVHPKEIYERTES
ncbi:carbon storage regulator [Microbulbifer variabilis]|nr:carbon storage regulator [Microbulbifer variabilis]